MTRLRNHRSGGGGGDEGGEPQEVAGDGVEVQKGKGVEGGGDDDGEGEDARERQDLGGTRRDRGGQLDDVGEPRPVKFPGREAGVGSHMAGGGLDSQGDDGLPGHWSCRCDVEVNGGNFKISISRPPSPSTTSSMGYGQVVGQVPPPLSPICYRSLRP